MKKGERTKESILQAAVSVAERDGYKLITRKAVAMKADCAESLINVYFHTMTQLQSDVMRYAVKNDVLKIIAQGLVNGDRRARKVSDEVKTAALKTLG